jgi:17beta-estradiol 17-dehydrogenase / very-long-chain 3-oxoacyl-CoA reductase
MKKSFFNKNVEFFVFNRISKRYIKNSKDKWAMITGCTSGIGKSFTEELANIGFNVILVSRNQSKLDMQAKEIQSKFKVKTKTIQFDFSKDILSDSNNFSRIKEELKEIPSINLLVNNVGIASIGPVQDFSPSFNTDMIKLNILSYLNTTQAFLEKNKENNEKLGIINVGSYYGTRNIPYVNVYSSTKAFLNNFSLSLSYENPDIDIICVAPLWVSTKMTRSKPSLFVVEPRDIVISCLLKIGTLKFTYGNWRHSILAIFINMIPGFIFSRIMLNYYQKLYRLMKRIKRN